MKVVLGGRLRHQQRLQEGLTQSMSSGTDARNNPNSTRRKLVVAVGASICLHLVILSFVDLDNTRAVDLATEEPKEILFVFPENEPNQIVENINANEEVPNESNLLSDRNSVARNDDLLETRGREPASTGNVPIPNLSHQASYDAGSRLISYDDGMTGQSGPIVAAETGLRDKNQNENKYATMQGNQTPPAEQTMGTPNLYEQMEHSVDAAGGVTLSTYEWEWAPYVNYFKRKLYSVWHAPPAYYGLRVIHGQTVIRLTIGRDGGLLASKMLRHEGHSSLLASSEGAIRAVFPLKPLPDDFPEMTLTITLTLHYPDLNERSD